MRRVLLFSLIFFILFIGCASATDYYVSPTGDDSNDGLSTDNPKLSMDLSKTLSPGDSLTLMPGTHTVGKIEFLTNSGTEDSHISVIGQTGAIVDAMGGYGVKITRQGTPIGYLDFSNLKITNGTDAVWIQAQFGTSLHHNISFTNLDIYGVYDGFDVSEVGTVNYDVSNLSIKNSYIHNFTGSAIRDGGSRYTNISNNIIRYGYTNGSTSYGIGNTFKDSDILNNLIEYNNIDTADAFYSVSNAPDCSNVTVQNNTIHDNYGKPEKDNRGIRYDYRVTQMKIYNNTVYNQSYGIDIYPDTTSILRNNTWTNCTNKIASPDLAEFYDNAFTDCSFVCSGGTTTSIGYMNLKGNTFSNTPINIYGFSDSLFENNIFKNVAQHAIYFYTVDSYDVTNLTIKNNVFYNVTNGIHTGSSDLLNSSIRNNIFCTVTAAIDNTDDKTSNTTVEYNCVYDNSSEGFVNIADSNSVFDPILFIDAGTDFRIKYASPCKDTGKPTDAYSLEPENNGDRIDIGAYGNTVNAPYLPTAAFTANNTSATAPKDIIFSDASTGGVISAWSWDLTGDTIEDSTDQNPAWTYSTDGSYDVSLTVTNEFGSDTETKTDYIVLTNPYVAPIILTTVAAALLFMRARRRW